MSNGILKIDLNAVVANWRALNAMTVCDTAAVVKANAYGLGMAEVSRALARAGARQFFVACAQEGAELRQTLGAGPAISVFSGHMADDTALIRDHELTPMLNSIDQMLRHVEALPNTPFGIQLDTGMNRLGMALNEWASLRDIALPLGPTLIMSHLACGDEPGHPANALQLGMFRRMTAGLDIPLSLSATGGMLLGEEYHLDLTRPGIGLYGGLPFVEAQSVVTLDLSVIQIRDIGIGETVGYGNTWAANRPSRIATVAAGYADGLMRTIGANARLFAGNTACPIAGRVSMDMICVDVTDVPGTPTSLQILGSHQSVDSLAQAAGTIGYEVLTSLGNRYERQYSE